jgi:50S ribosomal protein L16 3-hydroxylase
MHAKASAQVSAILGGLSPATFLRKHWQKKPLLVRQAFPGFAGLTTIEHMRDLAERDDVRARLVMEKPKRKRERWALAEGPFELELGGLPPTHWTLVVEGLEHLVPGAWDLLRAFSFLPAARIDDLMVSYAAPGGSVGPHDDLYDVFLVQGPGRRRWQIAEHYMQDYDENAPMKILRTFKPEQEWVLEPGDMLYLPPHVAHWGTAVDGPCYTYSVGFLAPSHDALAQNFLAFLSQERGERLSQDALYADPDLKLPHDPIALDDAMVRKVQKLLAQGLRWDGDDVAEFLGRLLTGPKTDAAFALPARPLTDAAFQKKLASMGRVSLAPGSRGLVRGPQIFLNGEMHALPAADHRWFHALLTARTAAVPASLARSTVHLLAAFARAGWIEISR